jgi:integrase
MEGTRYTEAWFKTKKAAKQAEAEKRKELANPRPAELEETAPIDMEFLSLMNLRLDHVSAYNSDWHYKTYKHMAKRWAKKWGNLPCSGISRDMVKSHILERSRVSAFTANKELRYLRANFNFGIKNGYITNDPTKGITFLPVERKIKYVPPPEDIDKVLKAADSDIQDYLWLIRDTMARVGEVNRLCWDDVNLTGKYIVLYTRKKRHGDLTPRKIAMTKQVVEIMSRRYEQREVGIPWVFWHNSYKDPVTGRYDAMPFGYRKTILKTLCNKVGVRRFGFHALRHAGASLMDQNHVSIGAIQRILGHENRSTTEIYLHSLDHAERDAIAVYEQARQKSHMTLTQRD